jgi:glycosyltransferase involved in cell wall biosynthesis
VRDIAEGLLKGFRVLERHKRVELVVASDRPESKIADVYVPRRAYILLGLPLAALGARADRILIPRQTVPPVSAVRPIPLFHDIGFIRRADLYPQGKKITRTTRIAARAKRALAVSEYTAQEMEEEGLNRALTALPIQAVHDVNWEPDGSDKYVLCVAAQEPHKNLVRLIHAWKRSQVRDARLIICGRGGLDTPRILEAVRQTGSLVTLRSGLGDSEYTDLLQRCWGYVQPSFYEGLCIPVMDLAAAGLPLVLSSASNLGAVFRSAPSGQLFDPNSVTDMAASLHRLVEDKTFREASSEFNRSSVSMTDWEAVAAVALRGMR